ncbi:MAG TPA: peptide ABC transporter substrate-binding protein, partial [Candidatus Nitrosotalea sp.]|nr:peptide ABC transporter substrate-binding protein [Candidatus Nitrosotalea sp.]
DGLVRTFHLRKDARWSDGRPVTAGDFVYSFQRMLTPALGTEYAYMLYIMTNAEAFNTGKLTDFSKVGVKAPDDYTLQITLNHPVPYFITLLSHPSWYAVPRTTLEKYGKVDERGTLWTRPGNHVGNGPFVLDQWRVNDVIVVKKSPTYWDRDHVRLNEIRFYPIESAATEERAFRAGQLHVTYHCPREKIDAYRTQHPEFLRIEPWLETYYFRVNVTKSVLRDQRVRQALGRAIDRRALVESVMRGGEIPAHHFTPPNTAGYTSAANMPTDYESARRLLAEAGFPNGAGFPDLELLYATSDDGLRITEAIQEMWKKELNIHVTVRNEEFKVFLDSQRRLAYDLSLSLWIGDYPDPSTFLDLLTTDNGNNQTGYSNPEYDRLIGQAAQTLDPARRYDIFQHAEALIMNEAPVIPLFFGTHVFLCRPEVKQYRLSIVGNPLWKQIILDNPAVAN